MITFESAVVNTLFIIDLVLCYDEPNLKLEDGMTKVFINAKGTVGDITPELKKFLKMLSRHEATEDFTRKLQEIIDFFHMDNNTIMPYDRQFVRFALLSCRHPEDSFL